MEHPIKLHDFGAYIVWPPHSKINVNSDLSVIYKTICKYCIKFYLPQYINLILLLEALNDPLDI